MIKKIFIGVIILIVLFLIYIFATRHYWANTECSILLKNLDKKLKSKRKNKEAIILIENMNGEKSHLMENEMTVNDKFMIASITKLYIHSVIFSLSDQGLVDLDSSISKYLPEKYWKVIHMIEGKDHVGDITVRHLINQTSGLADYEMDFKGEDSVVERLRKEDFELTEVEAIELTKKLEGKFLPGDDKAHYSNLNAILLGLIAEEVTGIPLIDLYEKYIFTPLNLKSTEIISIDNHVLPYINDEKANRYKYASSALACGGLVSNARELMTFIKAFHKGQLFDLSNIRSPKFNSIQFFPLKYGAGMMSVEISPLMSPLFDAPLIVGHSGLSGSFAFYCPNKDLFIVGSLNEFETNPFAWIYQYLNAVK